MDARLPFSIKVLAMFAGLFAVWPILIDLYLAFLVVSEDLSFRKLSIAFWIVFNPSYADAIHMTLWTGLLVSLLWKSRWALLFAALVALLAVIGLLGIWYAGGVLGSNGFTGFVLFGIIISIAPFFVLESTIRLWRRGTLT